MPTPGYVPRCDIPAPAPLCDPYIHGSKPSVTSETIGKIQTNPFVEPTERIAKNIARRSLKLNLADASLRRSMYSQETRGCSSVGRALRSQCRGREFKSLQLHLF